MFGFIINLISIFKIISKIRDKFNGGNFNFIVINWKNFKYEIFSRISDFLVLNFKGEIFIFGGLSGRGNFIDLFGYGIEDSEDLGKGMGFCIGIGDFVIVNGMGKGGYEIKEIFVGIGIDEVFGVGWGCDFFDGGLEMVGRRENGDLLGLRDGCEDDCVLGMCGGVGGDVDGGVLDGVVDWWRWGDFG